MSSRNVELLLFNPASNVVFGMLAVVADDASALVKLLTVRDSGDRGRLSLAGLVGDPARLMAQSVFSDGDSAGYAPSFASSMDGVHAAHSTGGSNEMERGCYRVTHEFSRA